MQAHHFHFLLFLAVSACGGRTTPSALDEAAPTLPGAGGSTALPSSGGAPSTTGGNSNETGGAASETGGATNETGGNSQLPPLGDPPKLDHAVVLEPAFVRGLVADPQDGSVYLAGYTWQAFAQTTNLDSKDAFLARFDAALSLEWIEQFGANMEEGATSLALSSAGILYVGGHTESGFNVPPVGITDAFVTAFDRSGSGQTLVEFGSVGEDGVEAIFEGPNGNLYLAGDAAGVVQLTNATGLTGMFVAEMTPLGEMVWFRQIGAAGSGQANDLFVTQDNSIFVVGYTDAGFNGSATSGGYDGYLLRLHPNGDFDWALPFATPEDDFATALELASDETIFIAGRTEGRLGQPQGESDAFVAAVSVDGQLLWLEQFGTPEGELVYDMEASADGNLYVSGLTNGSFSGFVQQGEGDAFIAKFDPLGQAEWIYQFGSSSTDRAMRLDSTDRLFVSGSAGGPFSSGPITAAGIFLADLRL